MATLTPKVKTRRAQEIEDAKDKYQPSPLLRALTYPLRLAPEA